MGSPRTQNHKTFAAYTEKPELDQGWFDRLTANVRLSSRKLAFRAARRTLAAQIRRQGTFYESCDTDSIQSATEHLRRLLHTHGIREDLAMQAFALVREVATRTIGQRHYDVQLLGGWALLHGFACEMQTGEGKTLTATLAACTAALSGAKVHIVTVNDYLAQRDAESMGPIYEALGLSVGLITHEQSFSERQRAYACSVTYCSNKELAFDYLRDRITLGADATRLHLQLEALSGAKTRSERLLLQGLEYAIVDELDSVLIDEARTPLLLSKQESKVDSDRRYEDALGLVAELRRGEHFSVDHRQGSVTITDAGRGEIARLAEFLGHTDSSWEHPKQREELVLQALTARELYQRDRHYIVRDSCVEIVDQNTGRSMPDRSWEHGLHQAIEAKERCEITPGKSTLAKISYQRFFRRYAHLSGMTGTAREVAGELRSIYGLGTISIPTHRPNRRSRMATQLFSTSREKWKALVERVAIVHKTQRPILIGTRSVHTSELVAELLELYGMHPTVLNARQNQDEAQVIAHAGEAGTITVATDMAGRGTDIELAAECMASGGLHVIAAELHESLRVERQLYGRCARQGQPGSHEGFVSLEDEVVTRYAGSVARQVAARWADRASSVPRWLLRWVLRHTQTVAQHRQRRLRKRLLDQDERTDALLGFAGGAPAPSTTSPQQEHPTAQPTGVQS
ncbi:MAG: prepilin peptidase [Planctomycetota bacterium]